MKSIPLCQPWFDSVYADRVREQILSTQIGPEPVTAEFASQLASYVGSHYCIVTTSGTVALSVASFTVGLKPGDEILVPAYGVISTINAFASFGLKPKLVDIERQTGCMSPTELKKQITDKTRAVCFVNFSGFTGQNLIEVVRICQERNLPLIEDAACALGHRFGGKSAGTFGDIGTYSFSVPKIITTGQGGALITKSKNYFEKARSFIDQGDSNWRKTNLIRGIGNNFRFNDILASFGLAQLKTIEKRIARKKATYAILQKSLKNKIFQVPSTLPPLHHIVFARKPRALINYLGDHGITAVRQYRTISQHPSYAYLGNRNFPNADFWTKYAVYLPFGLSLTEKEAQKIVEILANSPIALDSIIN